MTIDRESIKIDMKPKAMIAKRNEKNLYVYECDQTVIQGNVQEDTCQVASVPRNLLEWHKRTGHQSLTLTEKYANENGMSRQLPTFDCVSCKLAKAKRKAVLRNTDTRATKKERDCSQTLQDLLLNLPMVAAGMQ